MTDNLFRDRFEWDFAHVLVVVGHAHAIPAIVVDGCLAERTADAAFVTGRVAAIIRNQPAYLVGRVETVQVQEQTILSASRGG